MAKISQKKLALIHIVKKELNLKDISYRKILKKAAGVESAKDLSEEGFRKLMNFFARSRYYRANSAGLTVRQKIFIKILVKDLSWDKGHLDNFIGKYYHKKSIDELTKKQAMKLIESLKNVQKHKTGL